MKILLTNDDGIKSQGLLYLKGLLERNYGSNVITIVPDTDQSGASHQISIFEPVLMKEYDNNMYTFNGSPADCVKISLERLFKDEINLVISGINHGPNMGIDVHYSGTVAAAREACFHQVKSIAFSIDEYSQNSDYERLEKYCLYLIKKLLDNPLPEDILLNVNFPNSHVKIQGIKVSKLGKRLYHDQIIQRKSPFQNKYFWLGRDYPSYAPMPGSDFNSIEKGLISLTPLKIDQTAHSSIEKFKDWNTGFLG